MFFNFLDFVLHSIPFEQNNFSEEAPVEETTAN